MKKFYVLANDILSRLSSDSAARLFAVFLILWVAAAIWLGKYMGESPIKAPTEKNCPVDQSKAIEVAVAGSATATEPAEPELSPIEIDKWHAAYATWNRVDQTCYDSKTKIWFVHFVKDPNDENSIGTSWRYDYISNTKYLELNNNSIAILNESDIFNSDVLVTTSGLNCKPHTPS